MASRTRSKRRKKRSGVAGVFLAVLLLAALAAGGCAWMLLTPYGPASRILIQIAPGSSTMRIGRQLEEAGIIRSRYAFDLLRLSRRGMLRAGEYRFDHPAPVLEVYDRIARGDVYTIAVTVPEGANIFDIANRVQQSGLGTRQDFLHAAVEQAGLIADLDPRARSLEGYLFPDTYRFSPPVSAKQMMEAMVRRFRQEAQRIGLSQNVHDVVTVASLVERETAVDSERPLVASVFANRLARKMPLMSDPSVIYGLELEGRWRGTIYRSDLENDTAYNVYLHAGLPPGPIDNPGLPSLRAALHPAQTDYLYFVAAGDNPQGHSRFSTTLGEQTRNVAAYRKAKKRAGAQ
ncbi:MAG: endolytic transglycosylase MltG [Acidobacteriota bacterium]